MVTKLIIKFKAYDEELTDYVGIPEISLRLTKEQRIPYEGSIFFWDATKEIFTIDTIKYRYVDFGNDLRVVIFAHPQ